MSFDQAMKRKDQRLRRAILSMLKIALSVSPSGSASGRMVFDEHENQLEDDQHCLRLLRELSTKGYIEEKDTRTLKRQSFSLDHLSYRITPGGMDLLAGHAPVDPDIDDERLPEAD